MERVNPLAAGIALAATFALLSALCAIAFTIAPDSTINFFNAFMHGLDLNTVRSSAPVTLGRVLYGIVGLAIIGLVAGFVFAWTYNAVTRR